MSNLQDDERVWDLLQQHIPALMDIPAQLCGCLVEEAEYVGQLETDDLFGFVIGYPVEPNDSAGDRFPFFNKPRSASLSNYRHIRPVEPWPQPVVGMEMSSSSRGRVTGIHSMTVMLHNIGNAQVWFGGDTAVIFEAFLEAPQRSLPTHSVLLNQLWQAIEDYLASEGVREVFTYGSDREFDTDWYRQFLVGRGYAQTPTPIQLPIFKRNLIRNQTP